MTKKVKILIAFSIITIASILLLQFYWVRKYYDNVSHNYDRDVNLAFEDALRKDFILRCDTIEKLMTKEFLNTDEYIISSTLNELDNGWQYTIINKHDTLDRVDFLRGHNDMTRMTQEETAAFYAKTIKEEDLKNHFIFYRTQNMGNFLVRVVKQFAFDTTFFKPVFNEYLQGRNIHANYSMHFKAQDSLFNQEYNSGKIRTKVFPTYNNSNLEEKFVYASFHNPKLDIIRNISKELTASLALVVITGVCIYFLIRALLNERRLTVLKDDFISNITHELKTPIAVIAASLESVTDKQITLSETKKEKFLQHAKTEVHHLANIVEELLSVSLYDNSSIPVQQEAFNYKCEIKKIVDTLTTVYSNYFVSNLHFDIGDDTLVADPTHFSFIVTNILENSIKYRKNIARVKITSVREERQLRIVFLDNGTGIAKEDIARVFDKFYREPKKEHNIKGQGLGLYIVKKLIEANDGKVYIESKKNEYTKVTIVWKL